MPTISVQLYTLRAIEDDARMLDAVAQAGYDHVEHYGATFARAGALAPLMADRGIKASGSHVALQDLRDDMSRVAANAATLGMTSLFVPSVPVPQRDMDAAGWRGLGKELAGLADAAAGHGLTLGYHTHDWDFRPKEEGKAALDLVFEAAGSAPVEWEADIAWLAKAGVDPLAWLDRYSDRLSAVHVKDLAPAGTNEEEAGWADVGAGVLDWPVLWRAALSRGAEVMVVEHDKPLDPARTVAGGLRYIRDALL